jgi:hypothetical protein
LIKTVPIHFVVYFICLMLAGNAGLCTKLLQKGEHCYAEPAVLCWQHIEAKHFSEASEEHAASNFGRAVG